MRNLSTFSLALSGFALGFSTATFLWVALPRILGLR